MELEVTHTEPGMRGDTASGGGTKPANYPTADGPHPGQKLPDEQRAAAGPGQLLLQGRPRESDLAARQLKDVLGAERPQIDHQRRRRLGEGREQGVHLRTSRCRPDGRQQPDRELSVLTDQAYQHGERAAVSPVQVLEHEQRRSCTRQRVEQGQPRLDARVLAVRGKLDESVQGLEKDRERLVDLQLAR